MGIHEENLLVADNNGITGSSKLQNWSPISSSGQAGSRWIYKQYRCEHY